MLPDLARSRARRSAAVASRPRRALLDFPVHSVLLHVLVVFLQLQALGCVFPVLRTPTQA